MAERKVTRKQQRIDAQKAALRQRITDMLMGITGGYDGDMADVGVIGCTNVQGFGQWLQAMQRQLQWDVNEGAWKDDETARKHSFQFNSFEEFDTIDKATEYLYRQGFRA